MSSGKKHRRPRSRGQIAATRLERLRGALGRNVLAVTKREHVRWLTGFSGTTGIVLVDRTRAFFITDPRYAEQAALEVAACYEIICEMERPERIVARRGLVRPGEALDLEDEAATLADLGLWAKALPDVAVAGVVSPLAALRRRKDDEEIAAVRAALALTEEGMAWIAQYVRPGVTERELAARLEFYCRMKGASGPSFELIVASGPNSAKPHGVAGPRRIEADEVVLFDIGFFVDGYASDFTRVVYTGKKPPAALVRLHGLVREAQKIGIANLRVGAPAADADTAVRDYFRKERALGLYTHSLGHGVGLEIHEAPRLSHASRDILEPGTLVTVEPGLYRAGRYGIRLEDMVVVGARGVEVLTDFPHDLACLGRQAR